MPLTIERVENSRQKREYIMLPFRVNGKDPNWVPALFMDARNSLDRKRHPFHEHADVEFFWPADGSGSAVGRVCAIVNHAFVDYHKEKTGHFGFFEVFRNQGSSNCIVERRFGLGPGTGNGEDPGPVQLQHQRNMRLPGGRLSDSSHDNDAPQSSLV
ncbi:MAG: hypothetical protein M0C28_15730 [Candidatus Moduliflexus flocculans]|nr:hypothetical protein [Candidatus Moduliflexus flocculans]